MVALATAFVRMRPVTDKSEFTKAGQQAGSQFADGFYRDANGKLRAANGRFATDAERAAIEGGKRFGKKFSSNAEPLLQGSFKRMASLATNFIAPVAVAGAVAQIAKIGIAYEDSLNIFKSVSGATTQQMGLVADKARQLGADVKLPGVSAAGAAAAMTELAKAGFTVAESMDAAQGTLQLARAAGISEAQAATLTSNAVNAFNLKAKDSVFVSDELAAAANSSSVEITDVGDAFRMAASVFSSFQAPAVGSREAITELNTAIAVLGNNGIKGSDAGTSLKQMLLQLTGPTAQAKDQMALLAANAAKANIPMGLQNDILHGSKAVRADALKELYKLNPALKDQGDIAFDSAGKMRPLKDIIALTAAGTKGMTDEEKDYAITQIFGADASRAVIALMKGGLPVYESQRQAVLRQGAAADVAAAKNAGLGGALDNVRSQVENAAIAIYNQVKGPLTASLNDFAGRLPSIFSSIGAGFQTYALPVLGALGGILTGQVIPALAAAGQAVAATTGFLREHDTTARILGIGLGVLVGAIVTYRVAVGVAAIATRVWATLLQAAKVAQVAWTAVTWLAVAPVHAHNAAMALSNTTVGTWIGLKAIELGAWIRSTAASVASTASVIANRAAMLAHAAATRIVAAATVVWTAVTNGAAIAMRLAGVALRFMTGPIGLAITAIALITGAIIWLYKNNDTARKIIDAVWKGIKIAIHATVDWFVNTAWPWIKKAIDFVIGYYQFLWGIVKAVWKGIKDTITFYWNLVTAIFGVIKTWVTVTVPGYWATLKSKVSTVWGLIKGSIDFYWGLIKTIFGAVKTWVTVTVPGYFSAMKTAIANRLTEWKNSVANIWAAVRDNTFGAMKNFITKTLPDAFRTGVNAIKAAWEKVQEAAKKPVTFVVNSVINPLIRGYNTIAGVFGAPKASEIKGFAAGGKIPGAPSSRDNRLATVMDAGQKALGNIKVATGEFIVNTKSTLANLPLIQAINRKRGKVAPSDVDPHLDGFRRGGLVGGDGVGDFFKKVKNGFLGAVDFVKDPVGGVKRLYNSLIGKIPGAGPAVDMLKGMASKILHGLTSFLSGSGAAGGIGGGATPRGWANQMAFLRRKFPGLAMISGPRPGAHTLSGNLSYHALGRAVDVPAIRAVAAYIKSTVGRNALELITPWRDMNLWHGKPHRYSAAIEAQHGVGSAGNDHIHWAAQLGGLVDKLSDMPIVKLLDRGGAWPSGTLGMNQSGHTEHVLTGGPGGDIGELRDLLVALLAAVRNLGGDVAAALERPTRRAVQLGRGRGITAGGTA